MFHHSSHYREVLLKSPVNQAHRKKLGSGQLTPALVKSSKLTLFYNKCVHVHYILYRSRVEVTTVPIVEGMVCHHSYSNARNVNMFNRNPYEGARQSSCC